MKRIAVIISGSGSNLQALIDACTAGRIDASIVGVFSNRRQAYGLTRAEQVGIPTFVVPWGPYKEQGREAYDGALADAVQGVRPDLVVLAGFMRIVTPVFLRRFPLILNLHPALPGELPGTHAIERAWQEAQDGTRTETGVMVHEVVEEIDAGPVHGVTRVPIEGSLEALEAAMHAAEHALLVEVVARWAAEPPRTPGTRSGDSSSG